MRGGVGVVLIGEIVGEILNGFGEKSRGRWGVDLVHEVEGDQAAECRDQGSRIETQEQ